MKKMLITITSLFLLVTCTHHHKELAHHHHKSCDKNCKLYHTDSEMFDRYCAQSFFEGDLHIKGQEDFHLNHGGLTYYFSSKLKLETFEKNLEANATGARNIWEARSFRR